MTKKMKKAFAIVASGLVISILFAGCAKNGKPNEKETVTPEGVTVEGNQITVVYEENPTTGYEWVSSIDNERVAKLKSDEYKSGDDSSEDIAGAGGMHTFVFETEKAGRAVITMTYAQNWEGGETDKTITLNVEVDDSGKVAVE